MGVLLNTKTDKDLRQYQIKCFYLNIIDPLKKYLLTILQK